MENETILENFCKTLSNVTKGLLTANTLLIDKALHYYKDSNIVPWQNDQRSKMKN